MCIKYNSHQCIISTTCELKSMNYVGCSFDLQVVIFPAFCISAGETIALQNVFSNISTSFNIHQPFYLHKFLFLVKNFTHITDFLHPPELSPVMLTWLCLFPQATQTSCWRRLTVRRASPPTAWTQCTGAQLTPRATTGTARWRPTRTVNKPAPRVSNRWS